jgi:LysR family transcriptional regulator, glycine cleavage system transcriptional activator
MRRKPPPRLSLDLLRGFRAAARHLSFTKAAAELCVTQSAISQEVKVLEDQLGAALFARVNRTLRLTEAGERLYRAVDEALGIIEGVVADVSEGERAFAITATVPFASLWLGPRLAEFTRLHPGIGLRVVASNDTLDVARERIDVAIRHVPSGDHPPSGLKIFDHEVFPVCAPALLSRPGGGIRSVADLANHVLLEFETVRNGRPWYDWQLWLRAMKTRGVKPAGWLRFSHYDQVVEAAIAGSGVAIGKWPHLSRQLQQGTLVAPLGELGSTSIGAFYVVASTEAPHSVTESFTAWIRAEAQREVERRHRAPGRNDVKRAPRISRRTGP